MRPALGRLRRARRPFYAYTRAKKIMSEQYLVAQGKHARREDRTGAAQVRAGAVPGTSLGWSTLDSPVPEPRLAHDSRYDAALRAFLEARRGWRRGRRPLGLHLEVNISPVWIEEGGNLHDPTNPRVRAHWDTVVAWIAKTFGDALFALRIDLDETGGGVADAFLAPLRRLGHKSQSQTPSAAGRLWISVNRAMEEITGRFGHRKSENWGAINTSWAFHAKEHLDSRLHRGDPKRLTARRHVPIDAVRSAHAALDAEEAEFDGQVADLHHRSFVLAEVLAATLSGRIGTGAAGELTVRSAWVPARGGPPASREDDDVLRQDLRLVAKSHSAAVRAGLAFVENLLQLDCKQVMPVTTTGPKGARIDVQAFFTPGAQPQAEPDANDRFTLPDPTEMVPRPR